jgi:FkbM family methyltransferase
MNIRNIIKRFFISRGYSIVQSDCLHIHSLSLQLLKLLKYKNTDYIIDVGGNTGQYRKFIREVIGYFGPGCSVEPVPKYAKVIKKDAFHDQLWKVYECALGSKKGELDINVQGELSSFLELNRVGDSIFKSRPESRIKVSIDTVASILPSNASSVFLKIDTQGYELEVLKGAEAVFDKINIVQLEAPFLTIYDDQVSLCDLIEFMVSKQFLPAGIFRSNIGGYPSRMIDADMLFVRK